jgi:hypothetical protein
MGQIRSDWLPPENYLGFDIVSWIAGLTSKKALKQLNYFEVSNIQEVDNFIILKKLKNSIGIKVYNPFSFTISPFELLLHYEGGRGKPSPLYKTKKLPSLKPGKSVSFKIKHSLSNESSKKGYGYNFQEIKIDHKQDQLYIKLRKGL